MKVYKNIQKAKPKILSSIRKFGFMPEHNFYHFLYKQAPTRQCVFFDFGKGRGLMATFNKSSNAWSVNSEVLALSEERMDFFLKFLNYVFFKKNAKKVVVEFAEGFKSRVFARLKLSPYKVNANYSLYWPVYDLASFDEYLRGKQWKKFRNIRNRFHNTLQVKVMNPRKVGKDTLKGILMSWLRRRHPRDRVDHTYYLNAINNKLEGLEMARTLSINNEPCSISAGWKIPNSNGFYCSIGIFDYKHKNLGEFANLDDMINLKKTGYKCVDLGGSDKAILDFKKKFKPAKIYKTCIFSIARKKKS